ncbi:TPA: iron ABC transporter permease [Pasteurella multocida]|nr:iron ABC transporter permease [Pasteurella multocida]HDR1189476.1 iron ABC transporter permease [Pasteurella multocida]HDR1192183.1 iron ABC transporter permease [Pasteurella multocida]HDR1199941.1 iron ABC transporter permease [Pasteurella multocida]HDR1211413.1 iron ABC transporter permease [Pasteurella multocida]
MNVTARLWLPPILLVLVAISACLIGQYHIALQDVWQAVLHIAADNPSTDAETVLWNIRLPRIFTAIIVGAALSVAGATYQGMFKNPLVSPDILGVTAGAGLGAVTAIYFGGSLFTIQVVAFLGGLLAVFLVYLISRTAPHHSPTLALVLAGIAIASLLSAGISLLKILSDPYSQLTTITFWLMGGLNMATLNDLALVAPLICASLIPLILLRWRMNLLSLDDEEAETLGINTKRTRLIFILSATLMTSAAVSITGIIGWVGLIIPHIARLWIGADFRRLLPTSLFIGATFLLLTDTIARSIFSIEVPLGIITSLVGAPFFLSLLIQGGK